MSRPPPNPIAPNLVTVAASRVQLEAHRGGFGHDSADVAVLARSAMVLSPAAAVRVGALLMRAGLEQDPRSLDQELVAGDVIAIARLILGFGEQA